MYKRIEYVLPIRKKASNGSIPILSLTALESIKTQGLAVSHHPVQVSA